MTYGLFGGSYPDSCGRAGGVLFDDRAGAQTDIGGERHE